MTLGGVGVAVIEVVISLSWRIGLGIFSVSVGVWLFFCVFAGVYAFEL